MKIRNKILLYFSAISIFLVGLVFIIIYWISAEYREEEFQQRQKDKIITTLRFISEVEKDEKELTEAIDRLTINSFMNEKLLIFDSSKRLIYASLDDVPIGYSNKLLSRLNKENVWIEQKDGLYDVVAIYFEANADGYYGISKAYDQFGYTKILFLKQVLTTAFIIFTIIVLLISVYIANRISKPISILTGMLGKYEIGEPPLENEININTDTFEFEFLNNKFYELLSRINKAYTFQKNAVQHISHQLKTPIAILISELERIKLKTNDNIIQADIDKQVIKTKSLAEVINTLLEISKIEAGQSIKKNTVRADEMIFDCISELNMLNPDFAFEVNYLPHEPNADTLSIDANEMLIRQVFQNLLSNSIAYSTNNKAEIKIDTSQTNRLEILIANNGEPVSEAERQFLFTHFFRGENSRNKAGFGLGLVLVKSVIELHRGSITYSTPSAKTNIFTVQFPVP